ncbi:MAG: HU family DNA-binding protein [Gammaproteobacteria bacterium]|nr:HU family DNA-binding protein [Gammaproteobacteria bacterium]
MAVKKKVAKKSATKKAAPATVKRPPTKTQILSHIAEEINMPRQDVQAVFDSLNALIEKNLRPRAAGYFNMPGLLKIKVVKKPATKARKGINPFNGEEMMFKAKPARKVVKVTPLKGLKDMV